MVALGMDRFKYFSVTEAGIVKRRFVGSYRLHAVLGIASKWLGSYAEVS